MLEGMNLDPTTLIGVMETIVSQSAVREAQLQAAVQQLAAENQVLKAEVARLSTLDVVIEEEEA